MQWSKKYGPIFRIKLGFQEMVVLTGYETVKEAVVNQADAFADRAEFPIFEDAGKGSALPVSRNTSQDADPAPPVSCSFGTSFRNQSQPNQLRRGRGSCQGPAGGEGRPNNPSVII
ncbi:cytochrome P450 2H2-like [Ahaetulla prasina]|uniref:cytochrome P450 2H2-like n=1 Tax=Ahaetulla prasina TaxID=499056 RepID=UPI00264A4BAE|nr:cytochrome P450 2H2-like [Ahaetulla prasina]